jgi:peptide deformylase
MSKKETRRPMTVEEEDKFKDDMMEQAKKQMKEGTPDTTEGQWIDTTNIKKKLEKQAKDNGGILKEVPVEDIPYEVRDGVNPKTFNKQLIEPGNGILRRPVAPYKDSLLKEFGIKDRKELTESMFELMHKYGGIGLSAIQIGLPFNMFVAGDHKSIENGMKLAMFNPVILSTSDEKVMMKEGCLTFPFLFINIVRPRKCVMKYEDENGDLKEASLDGMMSRVCQHEYDHQAGILMPMKVSKMKLDLAYKKAEKEMKKWRRYQKQMEKSKPQKVSK